MVERAQWAAALCGCKGGSRGTVWLPPYLGHTLGPDIADSFWGIFLGVVMACSGMMSFFRSR